MDVHPDRALSVLQVYAGAGFEFANLTMRRCEALRHIQAGGLVSAWKLRVMRRAPLLKEK